jgi:hypothetical protein
MEDREKAKEGTGEKSTSDRGDWVESKDEDETVKPFQ